MRASCRYSTIFSLPPPTSAVKLYKSIVVDVAEDLNDGLYVANEQASDAWDEVELCYCIPDTVTQIREFNRKTRVSY